MESVSKWGAELHRAVVSAMVQPVVVADRAGAVVEWNPAAELFTGIPRAWAVGRWLWEAQAAVAPAAIPYEKASDIARESFNRLVRQSDSADHPWRVQADGAILSASGHLRTIHSEIFPVWIERDLVIVSVIHGDDERWDPIPDSMRTSDWATLVSDSTPG